MLVHANKYDSTPSPVYHFFSNLFIRVRLVSDFDIIANEFETKGIESSVIPSAASCGYFGTILFTV